MARSKARTAAQNAPRGIAGNMAELASRFGTEEACERHMLSLRWPGGFECPRCGHRSYARVSGRREYCCSSCRWQFSATSGTCIAHTRLPLTKWFRAAYMVRADPRGTSAQAVARECGVSDATGTAILRRLRTAMGWAMALCRVGGDWVELDGTDLACGNDGSSCHMAGSGATDAHVLAAVSGSRLVLRQASDRTAGSVQAFCAAHVSRGCEVRSDLCTSYASALAGGWRLRSWRSGGGGDAPESLPAAHHVFPDLKAKLAGTCHGVSAERLQEHLDEFSWKYCHRDADQMAGLLGEVARWPHVRLADIRGVRGPLGPHAPGREPGYKHDRAIEYRWRDGLRQRLVDALATASMVKLADQAAPMPA